MYGIFMSQQLIESTMMLGINNNDIQERNFGTLYVFCVYPLISNNTYV